MDIARILVASSATVIFLLGVMHLVFTFRGPKLTPRDASLKDKLKVATLHIAKRHSIWDAWIGFNVSHSLGAMMYAAIYGYLALFHSALLFASVFLGLVGCLMLVSYAALAHYYWFSAPFRGIVLALLLYLAGFAAALLPAQ